MKNVAIKNNPQTIAYKKVINGVIYVHYSYCKQRHDNFIMINGERYYDVSN